jgi:hypothetical protein
VALRFLANAPARLSEIRIAWAREIGVEDHTL